MLDLCKTVVLLFLLSACTELKPIYKPIVNYNSGHIQKIPKHKKKVGLIMGQAYYFPYCQGVIIYFYKRHSKYININYFNADFINGQNSICSNYNFDAMDMCMTCERRAIPTIRSKKACKEYNAPYWELVAIGKAANGLDTLFLEKKQNIKHNSAARLLPK